VSNLIEYIQPKLITGKRLSNLQDHFSDCIYENMTKEEFLQMGPTSENMNSQDDRKKNPKLNTEISKKMVE